MFKRKARLGGRAGEQKHRDCALLITAEHKFTLLQHVPYRDIGTGKEDKGRATDGEGERSRERGRGGREDGKTIE